MKDRSNKWFVISLAATFLLAATFVLAAGAVWAQPRGGDGRFGPPGMGRPAGPGHGLLFGPMAEKLDLSDEQREFIRGILETQRESMRPWHEDLQRLEGELEKTIEAEPFDEEAVRAVAQQVADVRVEVAVARARVAQEVREVLTLDQRETLGEMRAKRAEFRGSFGGPGGHHGRGHFRRGPSAEDG